MTILARFLPLIPAALALSAATAHAQLADLRPEKIRASRGSVIAGQRTSFDITIKNKGLARAGTHTSVIEIRTGSGTSRKTWTIASFRVPRIAALGRWDARLTFTSPIDLTSDATATLMLSVDTQNEVWELDEQNNKWTESTRAVGRPDLTVTQVNAASTSWRPSQSYAIFAETANRGAQTSNTTTTGIYLSTDSTLSSADRLLTQLDEAPLAPGAKRNHNRIVRIPNDAPTGRAYIGYWIDNRGFVTEGDETNNAKVLAGNIGAPGTTTPFGSGCRGKRGTPSMTSVGLPPHIGGAANYALTNGAPRSAAIFALGFSKTRFGGSLRLPLDLGFLGARTCRTYTSHDLLGSAPIDAAGKASLRLQIPLRTSLTGSQFHTQWLVLSPGSNAFGLIVSNAMTTTIGSAR